MIFVVGLLCFVVGISAAMINATLEELTRYTRELAKRERARNEN